MYVFLSVYILDLPLMQDSSHHQVGMAFVRSGIPTLNFLSATGIPGGGRSNLQTMYTPPKANMTIGTQPF